MLVYDEAAGRFLLFGGAVGGQGADDLWSLSLTPGSEGWTALAPASPGPIRRYGHGAVYDAAYQRMVVYGGRGGAGGGLSDDTFWY